MFIPKFNDNVKKLVKIKQEAIDGPIFNLHCKFTAVLLFLGSAIVSMQMNVGKPISCVSDIKDNDKNKVVETFCWVNSTFKLIPELMDNLTTLRKKEVEINPIASYSGSGEKIFYAYYQWVGFVLFFEACLFYAPKWFWKLMEGKLMKGLLGTGAQKLEEEEMRQKRSKILTNYFIQRLKGHRSYAITYWLFEVLCLCNVLIQFKALDTFLGGNGNFLTYGLKFRSSSFDLDSVFPLQTKCTFNKYGPGGQIQNFDALCVLFLNFYNRIIFVVLWYWFIILASLLTLLLIHRGFIIFSSWLRFAHIRLHEKTYNSETKLVVRKLPITDWWALYMLKGNIDALTFKDIILELSKKLTQPTNKLE